MIVKNAPLPDVMLDSMKQATVRDEVSKNIRWFLAIVSANHINVWNGLEFDRGSIELLVC